jgi:hypothetical protein
MTPEFRKAIFTWNYDPQKHGAEEWCITLQLQRLFGLLQLSKQRAVDTVALTHSFGWEGSEVFQQQDVQELTRVLFDALEQTLKGTEVENIIDDLYAGELIDYLRCIDVDYESERVDKFLDFSLAIVPFGSDKPMHSLTECIEMFLKPEILDGDNKYYAEKFNMKVDAIKGLKFGKLPQIMSVQLKRFVYDFTGPTIVQKKLNDVVKFPMILDMNRYVGRRASVASDCPGVEDGVDGAGERVSNEFEEFLRAQMESLKSSRTRTPAPAEAKSGESSSGHTTDPSTSSSSGRGSNRAPPPSSAEGDADPDRDHDHGLANAIHEAMHGPAPMPDLISDPPDYEDLEGGLRTVDLDSPSLPEDSGGGKSPDAVPAVGAEGGASEPDAGVCYASMSPEQVAEMVAARGEWVYELYAVLIHSGMINGGHYYAYIKDLTSGKWWNFNDSTVTAIDEKTVQETWGRRISYGHSAYQAPTFYGNSLFNRSASSGGTLSSANAYMLMYRKVTPRVVDPSATGAGLLDPPPVVTEDMVPQYIRDLVDAQAKEAEERRRAQEAERDKLNLRVYFQGKEHNVPTARTATFASLMTLVWHQLGLREHLGEVVVQHRRRQAEDREHAAVADYSEAASPETTSPVTPALHLAKHPPEPAEALSDAPCFDLFRLRNYNTYTQLRSDAWEVDNAGSLTLGELNFHSNRTFYLETRSGGEDWEVYYADGITVLLLEYDPASGEFKEPRNLRLRRTATLGDVRKTIAKWTAYDESRVRIMKIVNCGYNDAQLDILTDDNARLREDLSIYEGYKLYFEDAPDPLARSKAYDAFLQARNSFELRVSRPGETEFDVLLKADLRWTVTRLREVVAHTLGVAGQELRMFKQSLRGQELRDGTSSLAVSGLYNQMALAVCYGKATPMGYFNIQLTEYIAKDNRVGVVELPVLPDEEEEVSGTIRPAPINAIEADTPPPPLVPEPTSQPFSSITPPPPPFAPAPPTSTVSAAVQVGSNPFDPLYGDYDPDLDAALAASLQDVDIDSTASNAGVADADELQLCDDDLDACRDLDTDIADDNCDIDGNECHHSGYDAVGVRLIEDDAVAAVATAEACALGSDDAFELGAAKVAQNCDLESASCSLKVPLDDAAGIAQGTPCAVPLLDVSRETLHGTDSDMPSLTSIDTSPIPAPSSAGTNNDYTDVAPSDFGEKMVRVRRPCFLFCSFTHSLCLFRLRTPRP